MPLIVGYDLDAAEAAITAQGGDRAAAVNVLESQWNAHRLHTTGTRHIYHVNAPASIALPPGASLIAEDWSGLDGNMWRLIGNGSWLEPDTGEVVEGLMRNAPTGTTFITRDLPSHSFFGVPNG
ncbi:MAG: hypothetical protein RhofKO_25910 [Rhodothermales bacterium]